MLHLDAECPHSGFPETRCTNRYMTCGVTGFASCSIAGCTNGGQAETSDRSGTVYLNMLGTANSSCRVGQGSLAAVCFLDSISKGRELRPIKSKSVVPSMSSGCGGRQGEWTRLMRVCAAC
jgi:hypothetical protein